MVDLLRAGGTGEASHRCVAYVAAGERFREEANWSLASLRRFMPELPAVLFTDGASASSGAFDEVVPVRNTFADVQVGVPPWPGPGWLMRIDAMIAAVEKGSWQRLLFLDTDVEITGDIGGVFGTLERFDIAAVHAPFRVNEQAADIPDAFPEFNVGLVALRSSPAALRLLIAWREAYLAQPEWWHHDQVSFRRAVWSSDIRVATLPPEFNVRPARYAGGAVPRVLHGFARYDPQRGPDRRIRLFTTDLSRNQPMLGWEFGLRALAPLTHPNGVLFDPMVDATFGWNADRYARCLPQREPWVGVVHNPPGMAGDGDAPARPETYTDTETFRRSLPNCLGLFAFSERQAEWFRRFGVPVEVLCPPLDLLCPPFSAVAFRRSEPRQLLQLGSWLQQPRSFAQLSCTGYRKILVGVPGDDCTEDFAALVPDIELSPFKSQYHHNALLQRSVVFADVTAAAAHPVVLECLARATPIVVSRHPAILDYLGADYPLVYDTLEEAEALLRSEERLIGAHRFLAEPARRRRHSQRAFAEAIVDSSIYRGLPSVV